MMRPGQERLPHIISKFITDLLKRYWPPNKDIVTNNQIGFDNFIFQVIIRNYFANFVVVYGSNTVSTFWCIISFVSLTT